MDVTTARTFLAAAATGSFQAAAKRVNASPSTVTDRIKQLEHRLGAKLFTRDKRGCALTAAGRRFVEPARSLIRAWESGRARLALPAHFQSVVRIGGQHALWPSLLMPWLQSYREDHPDLALFASAAAPAQLSRALDEDELDIAFLYDPVVRRGLRIERLAPDRLILVTSRPGTDWRTNFVRLNWSDAANLEMPALIGELPGAGFELDLGVLSLDWLVVAGSSGFVPARLAEPLIAQGQLTPVAEMTALEFSPFACWRSTLDETVAMELISCVRAQMRDGSSISEDADLL